VPVLQLQSSVLVELEWISMETKKSTVAYDAHMPQATIFFIHFNSKCKHRSSWIIRIGVKLLFQVFVGQWSRIDLGSKSMVKFNFSQVNTLTTVADRPTVSMFVTLPCVCKQLFSCDVIRSRYSRSISLSWVSHLFIRE